MKRNRCGGVGVEAGGESLISSAGAALLVKSAQVSGLSRELSGALSPWRPARSVHDPGKTVLDLAVTIALGGDCLADAALVRAQPELFGTVASDPTISRLIDALGEDSAAVITAIRTARAAARARVWGHRAPVPATGPVIIDLDATLIGAHSEKEGATANFKRGFGFHPLLAFVDHGAGGTGEPLVAMLRPGRANANTAADQIAVLDDALGQLPEGLRERVLVRGDSGSGVQPLLWHITNLGLTYSVGFSARQPVQDALAALPRQTWRAARDADGEPRLGAQVAELTRWMPATLTGWPPGMRLIARRERPHPGAQLHITDDDGWRITVFATNTVGGRIAELEVRHRLRARAEDRIRGLKDTGMTNLPLQAFDKNQVWLELACLAYELLTWTQLLAFHDRPARAWEPKRLRLRILAVAARLVTTGRRRILRLPKRWPWTDLITSGHQHLAALA